MQASDNTSDRLGRIWAAEGQYVRRMLIGLARDLDLADDLLQETYLKASHGITSYRGDNDRSWLSTIARNTYLSHVRRRYVISEQRQEEQSELAGESTVGCIDHLELIQVRDAVSCLDPNLRTALLMKHYCGFSYEEIAEQTGSPLGTVKWRVSDAVGKLRAALEEARPMTCADLSRVKMLDYLYGALPAIQLDAIRRHLAGCPKCRMDRDGDARTLYALDALEAEKKQVQIIELGKDGGLTLYSLFAVRNESILALPEGGEITFIANTGSHEHMQYLGALGEELQYTVTENNDPRCPDTERFRAKLPRPVETGEVFDLISVYRYNSHRLLIRENEEWKLHWRQTPSVELEFAFALAVRLPSEAELVSASPAPMETKTGAGITLLWRALLPPETAFECDISYRLRGEDQ